MAPRKQLAVVLALLGVVGLPIAFFLSMGVLVLGESADAVVVDLSWHQRDAGRACVPTFAYDVEGVTRRGSSAIGLSPCPYELGERVRVHYWADAPDDPLTWSAEAMLPMVLPALLLGAAAWVWTRRRPPSERMRETEATPIAGAVAGSVVKIRGRIAPAEGDELLLSPLTDRPCVASWTRVSRRRSGEPDRKVRDESRWIGFVVRDGDDEAFVDAATEVKLAVDADAAGSTEETASAELEAFLSRHGDRVEPSDASSHYVWYEGLFEPNAEVFVLGRLEREADGAARVVAPGPDEAVRLEHVDRARRKREIPTP